MPGQGEIARLLRSIRLLLLVIAVLLATQVVHQIRGLSPAGEAQAQLARGTPVVLTGVELPVWRSVPVRIVQ